jgi:CBS domain-containing protein
MLVSDVMTESVVTVTPATSLREVGELLVAHGISGLPVLDRGRVVGVVSEADIVEKEQGPVEEPRGLHGLLRHPHHAARLDAFSAGQAMTSPAVTIEPWVSIWAAAATIVEHDVSRLPVVSRGELVGLVTRSDLVKAFTRADSEIEREIREEVLPSFGLSPAAVSVRVHRGDVLLEGALASGDDVAMVHGAVQRVVGVLRVHEDIVTDDTLVAAG